MIFQGLFQPKPFSDSLILNCHNGIRIRDLYELTHQPGELLV